MTLYFLTPQAIKDVEEIHDFVCEKNPAGALRLLNLIEKKCESLAKAPAMGRIREEIAPNLRSFPVKKYVLFYRQTKGRIEILRILHGARDIGTLLREKTS